MLQVYSKVNYTKETKPDFYSGSVIVNYIHSTDSSCVEATGTHISLSLIGEDQLPLYTLSSPFHRFRRQLL